MFSIQADEVTDISNKEQMTLLLRYLKDGKPIETLVEYILCESITGVVLCEDIQRTLSGLNLGLQNVVSQTYDGATNFSGQIKGCAALFQQTVPHATYFHCSNHDLNLALCHTCKDIPGNQKYAELCYRSWTVFQVLPKRLHVLEATLLEYNMMKNVDKRINTAKIKLFFATRWVERHLVLEEIIALYEPLLTTLQKIATEKGWDCKTANSAYSLIKSITMAIIAETELIAPRICQRMTKRSNIPAGSSKDYFKVAVLIPTIDHLLSELEFRFSQIQVHAACGMYLIPKNLQDMSSVHRDNIFRFFEWALPSPQTFNQELDVWKQMWHDVVDDAPDTLQTSLAACE